MVVRLLATGQYKPSARWHSLSTGKTLLAKITKDQAPAATKGTRPDVANMPRQSVVAFADYVNTLATHAPERLAEIVAPDLRRGDGFDEGGERSPLVHATQLTQPDVAG